MEEKKWIVVAYLKVIPEDMEPMTRQEAISEAEQLSLMQPENIYQVELLEKDEPNVVQ